MRPRVSKCSIIALWVPVSQYHNITEYDVCAYQILSKPTTYCLLPCFPLLPYLRRLAEVLAHLLSTGKTVPPVPMEQPGIGANALAIGKVVPFSTETIREMMPSSNILFIFRVNSLTSVLPGACPGLSHAPLSLTIFTQSPTDTRSVLLLELPFGHAKLAEPQRRWN